MAVPGTGGTAILVGAVGAALVLIWWLLFSRAPWLDRIGAVAVMAAALFATAAFVHPSIANGMMGMMLPLFAIPLMSVALVAAAAAGARLPDAPRRVLIASAIVLACASMTLVRTDGITGDAKSLLRWRWTPTAEERLLAQSGEAASARSVTAEIASPPAERSAAPAPPAPPPPDAPAIPPAESSGSGPVARPPAAAATATEPTASPEEAPSGAPAPAPAAKWPGFRGPERDGVVRGVQITTDWSRRPPVELWRKPVGPGWSSFAVQGGLVYTQEQRGEDEVVSCYRLSTGEPVWRHRDPVRFWESNGGAGPRATPTLSDGRVYTLGATGVVNALDARTGALLWSRNAATDTGTDIPGWGFAGSPLAIEDVVVIAVSGRLLAYEAGTGHLRWIGPPEGGGYSSPHLMTIGGVPQVLLQRGRRTTSVAPADGSVLWEDSWQPGVSIVQPARASNGDVLIAGGDAMGGTGMKRVAVSRGPGGWTLEERWTTRGLKPYFNDFVVHKGHAFGFDGSILASINLETGERNWKGGRYGHGQMLLLPDQDLLLVLSEEGEVVLVRAAPDRHTELARFKAIEGKTWNHPVLVGDLLLVRNGEEMAAFRVPTVR